MASKTYRRDASAIEASPGDTFVLELESTPGGGYQWQVDTPPGLVRLVDRKVHVGSGVGGASTERLTFEALATGDGVAQLKYKRAWESASLETKDIPLRVK